MKGAGCRVQGAGVQGAGCRVQGAGCRVQGCRVQGAGCRVQGAGFTPPRGDAEEGGKCARP